MRFNDADWLVAKWMDESVMEDWPDLGEVARHPNHHKIVFHLSADPGYTRRLTLDLIVSLERFQGHASRFLHELCADCDNEVLELDLQAAAFENDLDPDGCEPLSQAELVEWYETFGFVEHNDGLGEKGYWMRRMPNL